LAFSQVVKWVDQTVCKKDDEKALKKAVRLVSCWVVYLAEKLVELWAASKVVTSGYSMVAYWDLKMV